MHRWWTGGGGRAGLVLDRVLAPAELAFRSVTRLRNAAYDHGLLPTRRVDITVVSIGNLAVGGTGKTPFTHWLAARLRNAGAAPAILHGGYAADEPELHRRWAPDIPVIARRDRVLGALEAQKQGASVVLLDDAFQHRRLARDIDIVLIAAETWTTRRRLLPRGPWRETQAALGRADVVVCTRKTAPASDASAVAADLRELVGPTGSVVRIHIMPDGWWHAGRESDGPADPVVAVAALARPDLFVDSVRASGVEVAEQLFFRDHHTYTAADVARIRHVAGGRPIVTSEKDWVRLEGLLDASHVWLLRQAIRVEQGEDMLTAVVDRVLQ